MLRYQPRLQLWEEHVVSGLGEIHAHVEHNGKLMLFTSAGLFEYNFGQQLPPPKELAGPACSGP